MTSKAPTQHSITIKSLPFAIAQVSEQLVVQLSENNFSEDDIFAVRLSLEEAFVNAVLHGNDMDPKKNVVVNYCVSDDKVEISIVDEGSGFDPVTVPDPRCDENLYKNQGRGLLLIRSYMDCVDFNDLGNCVRMVRHKGSLLPYK